ncbi:MAG: hypothetical protein IBX48_09430 [Thiomicrospira sp.]|uniref:hypothetical protein n=1 Tax=Thiomicrospira sp. TaxID=935 RepID=UPI0019EF796F|nr:hypothetical protein [Thiomicrospira sp.]MBE0494546.1 hypothetical protein [Thiomicrospira sp.]
MTQQNKKNILQFIIGVAIVFVLPLVVFMGIYFDLLPASLLQVIGMIGVISAVVMIIGGGLFMAWSDIKTGRYKNRG